MVDDGLVSFLPLRPSFMMRREIISIYRICSLVGRDEIGETCNSKEGAANAELEGFYLQKRREERHSRDCYRLATGTRRRRPFLAI